MHIHTFQTIIDMSYYSYCRQLDVEYAAPYQVNIMECVCQLLPDATEETLMLLLQSLCAVIKIKPEVTAQYEHILTPAVLNTWKRFPTDSIIASYILDAVEGFAKNEHYAPALYGRCLPFLDSVFKTVSNQPVVMAVSEYQKLVMVICFSSITYFSLQWIF